MLSTLVTKWGILSFILVPLCRKQASQPTVSLPFNHGTSPTKNGSPKMLDWYRGCFQCNSCGDKNTKKKLPPERDPQHAVAGCTVRWGCTDPNRKPSLELLASYQLAPRTGIAEGTLGHRTWGLSSGSGGGLCLRPSPGRRRREGRRNSSPAPEEKERDSESHFGSSRNPPLAWMDSFSLTRGAREDAGGGQRSSTTRANADILRHILGGPGKTTGCSSTLQGSCLIRGEPNLSVRNLLTAVWEASRRNTRELSQMARVCVPAHSQAGGARTTPTAVPRMQVSRGLRSRPAARGERADSGGGFLGLVASGRE